MAGVVQSVELLLDGATEAQVRREWSVLADAGLPSQARHTGASNAPHVTLLARPEVDDSRQAELSRLTDALPLPLRLGGLAVLGGRRLVLVRLVVVSRALLELQEAVVRLLGGGDHFGPGVWTPHVTLARRLTPEQTGTALGRLTGGRREIDGQAAACRRWDGDARHDWLV